MQKVEGSNPFSRLPYRKPRSGGAFCYLSQSGATVLIADVQQVSLIASTPGYLHSGNWRLARREPVH